MTNKILKLSEIREALSEPRMSLVDASAFVRHLQNNWVPAAKLLKIDPHSYILIQLAKKQRLCVVAIDDNVGGVYWSRCGDKTSYMLPGNYIFRIHEAVEVVDDTVQPVYTSDADDSPVGAVAYIVKVMSCENCKNFEPKENTNE